MRSSLLSHIISPNQTTHQSSVTFVESSSTLVDVDRLLIRRTPIAIDRLHPFGPVPAYIQLLRVVFKGILETVRETVFSESGSKQLQIDLTWLRDTLNNRLVSSRRMSHEDSRSHFFGHQVPQRQAQTEDSQFRLISILVDEMMLSSATSAIVSLSVESIQMDNEMDLLLGCLVPSDELNRIIQNEEIIDESFLTC